MNAAFDLVGKSVLVTGGSRGIGRGMAEALCAAGAQVMITGRDADSVAIAARELGCNCQDAVFEAAAGREAIEAFAEQVWDASGGFDVVFNNAGSVEMASALDVCEAAWENLVAANLSGMFWASTAFGRRMIDRGHGKLINVASDLGIRGAPNWAAYAATKGGVVAMSKSLAWEWAPTLSVNIVAPGPFDTPSNAAAFAVPEVLASVQQQIPLGIVGDPRAHLGPLAVLLAGPGSDFVTGAVFRVDGGICRS